MLDGSGSMNPSGVGTLTYNWVFTSRPPGTATRLVYTTSVNTMFVADVPGTYVLTLTVSNGVGSGSASVTVTARRNGLRRDTPNRAQASVESRKSAGTDAAAPPRFPSPLIKPDVRISRIRLSDWLRRRLTNARPSALGDE
jgi:hypothetical protein